MRPFRPAQASLPALLLLLLALLGGCVPAASGGSSPAPDDGEGGAEHDVIARPSFHEGTPLLVAFDECTVVRASRDAGRDCTLGILARAVGAPSFARGLNPAPRTCAALSGAARRTP